MHVSGHGTVEWVQRYACAKLSETNRLAGGWVFHGGDPQTKNKSDLSDITLRTGVLHIDLSIVWGVVVLHELHVDKDECNWPWAERERQKIIVWCWLLCCYEVAQVTTKKVHCAN